MKIGLFGIDTNVEDDYFFQLQEAIGKSLSGIYSPQQNELLAVSEKFGVKLYKSSDEIFSKNNAIFFCKSLKPNYDFAIKAIKNSCHLFIEDLWSLDADETKQLFKLAFEAKVNIHIKQSTRFYPEHIELSDYIEKPHLIELNIHYTDLLRKQDYFDKIFSRLCFANTIIKSGIKKSSIIALPIDRNHFSLVQIQVNYDNGTYLNIKINNLASSKKETTYLFQKNTSFKIDCINHFAVSHSFENGQVSRKEYSIQESNILKNEVDYFIKLCSDNEQENISESPSILTTLKNCKLLMEEMERISNKI